MKYTLAVFVLLVSLYPAKAQHRWADAPPKKKVCGQYVLYPNNVWKFVPAPCKEPAKKSAKRRE